MLDDRRTDEVLVAAVAAGDDASFAVLVRRHIRGATLLAAQFTGDRAAAEDVAQDAFVVVYRNARRFDTARAFAPWFFAIVRRIAANRRSRDLRRARLLRVWGWIVQGAARSSRPEAALNARLDAATARRAMESLPPMQRACFELVAVRGLSTTEVAAMHDISESTVRQHVFRARAALKARLGGSDTKREEA